MALPSGINVASLSFTLTELIVRSLVPEFLRVNVAFVLDQVDLLMLTTLTSSVFMNVNVRAPIHAATAIETATVTAIKIIAATTGLSAFLLLNNFLILDTIPPFQFHYENRGIYRFKSYDLLH